jgi:hypothetical protein
MEIVYFVLGVVTVLLILGVVVIVRVGTLVKELKETIQHLERGSNDEVNNLHRRIEDEVRELRTQLKEASNIFQDTSDVLHRRIDDEVRELQSNINENERDVLSVLDSRLDKLESKIKQQLPKG